MRASRLRFGRVRRETEAISAADYGEELPPEVSKMLSVEMLRGRKELSAIRCRQTELRPRQVDEKAMKPPIKASVAGA